MQTELNDPLTRFFRGEMFGAAAALAARLLAALLFVSEGWGKITAYADVQSYMAQFGVEPRLLPLAILLEFAGGLALAAGFATRPLAILLGLFSALVAFLFHSGGDYNQILERHKDLAIAGGLFALAALGPGLWSLDALIARYVMPAWGQGRTGGAPP